jgi:TolB-like protein/class 3 adenylate cyclase/tetratricopeptide (TPR) repeat protein
MSDAPTNRRLAAILAADVVGYSRMMGSDEAGTLAALKRHRKTVFDPAVAAHNGRIVKLIGDGVLVEFGSVVDAVHCAVSVQEAIAANGEDGIRLRIGINLGDVIIDGDDIYGDGVNVAARLEPLAQPGGICISALVRDSVSHSVASRFADGGEVTVKNIDHPVHIWKWHPAGPDGAAPQTGPAVGHVVLPTLAVLPFQNMSGDREQEYFADGIVEDITTAFSRFKSFAVIARNSSFVYKGRAVDVRQVARELDVRYLLEGSVRRAGDRLRITAQLVEGDSGAHLWARNFDGTLADVFDVQDHITESVVGIVEPHIRHAEIERARRKRPESLDAYDLFLKGMEKHFSGRPDDNAAAYTLMQRAIALEPDYAPFLAGALWVLEVRTAMGWKIPTDDDRATALDLARRALATAHGDAAVLAQCAITLLRLSGEYERGMQTMATAVELNPNNWIVLWLAGVAEVHCGSLDAALAHSRRAMNFLGPSDPSAALPLTTIAHAELLLGQYEDALKTAERAAAMNPPGDFSHRLLVAGNAKLGRLDEARRWLAELRARSPGVTISRIRAGEIARDPSRIAPILDGMRLAGLEES